MTPLGSSNSPAQPGTKGMKTITLNLVLLITACYIFLNKASTIVFLTTVLPYEVDTKN